MDNLPNVSIQVELRIIYVNIYFIYSYNIECGYEFIIINF